jgi:hypothetical protein
LITTITASINKASIITRLLVKTIVNKGEAGVIVNSGWKDENREASSPLSLWLT